MTYRLSLNISQINDAVKRAFKETALLYSAENTKAISKVGAFSSHPESDIVDTGRLRSSQTLVFTGDTKAELSWPVQYAVYVHEGYIKRNGTVILGRPWTEKAQENLNIQRTFNVLFNQNL